MIEWALRSTNNHQNWNPNLFFLPPLNIKPTVTTTSGGSVDNDNPVLATALSEKGTKQKSFPVESSGLPRLDHEFNVQLQAVDFPLLGKPLNRGCTVFLPMRLEKNW